MRRLDEFRNDCWINVVAPDAKEQEELETRFEIPPEFLKAAMDEEESSRIDREDDHTLIIIDVPYLEKFNGSIIYMTMPVGIIMNERYIMTISLKDSPILQEFAEGTVKNVHTNHRTQFVLHIMLRMSTRFLQYLKQIDKQSGYLEMQLRKSMRNREIINLMDLQKSLVYFQTSLKSDEITLEKILRGRYIKMYDEDQELLEDVLIEIKQAVEMSNIYLSILTGTTDAFASVISNNLNIVMKVLTSITILMAIPTMIFSFYGMNIGSVAGGLPGAATIWIPLGFAVAVTLIVGIILYRKDMF
ncbi:MAG TPA: magnesium transporter [Ruminococcaceae bacterium]|nr:magnesium transporter [Oscillospiraceae bacterium]